MTKTLAAVFILTAFLGAISGYGQEHLVPEPGQLADYDDYYFKVQEIFAKALDKDQKVVCQVTILGSFGPIPECLVGVRQNGDGYEIFTISPVSSIWDTELIRMYEAGGIRVWGPDDTSKPIPLEKNEGYQKLKKNTPADFRAIKTEVKAVAIDEALARRIAAIWERMLLATRHPKKKHTSIDGGSYHFSMWVEGRGVISGKTWSLDAETGTGALADLSNKMIWLTHGITDLAAVRKAVVVAEKRTK